MTKRRKKDLQMAVELLKPQKQFSINTYALKHHLQHITRRYISPDELVAELRRKQFELKPMGRPMGKSPNFLAKINLKELYKTIRHGNI